MALCGVVGNTVSKRGSPSSLVYLWRRRFGSSSVSVGNEKNSPSAEAEVGRSSSRVDRPRWPSIGIVGGGIAGLSFANLLIRRYGAPHDCIKVFEQASERELTGNAGIGFTIGSGKFIIEHLMGLPEVNSICASPITKFVNRTFDGRSLGRTVEVDKACLQEGWPINEVLPVGMQRSDLIRLLVSSLPKNTVQYNKRLASITTLQDNNKDNKKKEEDEDKVSLKFLDGEEATFDIVVGADGIRSTVKEHVLLDNSSSSSSSAKPVYSGYAIWYGAARLPLPPSSSLDKDLVVHDGTLIKLMGNDGNFGCNRMGPSRTPGADDGLLAFWVTHKSKEVKTESWDLKHSKDELMEIVKSQSCNEATKRFIEDVASRAERVFHLGLFYHGSIPTKWHKGRVVLLGDAPHAMLPFLGQGANQAIEDAESLARLISSKAQSSGRADRTEWESVFEAYTKERYEKATALANNSLRASKLQLTDSPVKTVIRNALISFMNNYISGKAFVKLWINNIKDVLRVNGIEVTDGRQLEEGLKQLKQTTPNHH